MGNGMSTSTPWPFRKLTYLSPSVPAVEIELMDLPIQDPAPPVCYVCGISRRPPDPALEVEPRECSVCGGTQGAGGER